MTTAKPLSRWRAHSRRVIAQTVAAWLAAEGRHSLFSLPRADASRLLEAVLAAYPFGERSNHPYKIWLSEVRCLKGELGFAAKARPTAPATLPGLEPGNEA